MFVRWSNLRIGEEEQRHLPGYRDPAAVRRFEAPEALDTRFYEVHAKSILNRVPEKSRMPFRWTINPYRGCAHACVFCFARPTHKYLDFDAGRDFEREIVVKVNAPEVLRAELARPSWKHEHVALGTNTDPYQWVEGRYRLMEGIWQALRDAANPCSVLTKSPLLLRDLKLMLELATQAGATSIGGVALHLRGEVRGIFMDWLRAQRPDLLPRYQELYRRGAYAPREERERLSRMVRRRGADPGFRLAGHPPPEPDVAPPAGDRQEALF